MLQHRFIFFVTLNLISISIATWNSNSFNSAIQVGSTFDFSFNSDSTQINYAVNCSSPCKIELVGTSDVTKVKNNLAGYISYFSTTTKQLKEINVNKTEISLGLSLTIKNTGTSPFNVWVNWNFFSTTPNYITTDQIAYIVIGIVGGKTKKMIN